MFVNACGGGGGGGDVARENGPANYDDKCGIAQLGVGHDIFGHEGDSNYAVKNEYGVSAVLAAGSLPTNIGYIYTTIGGSAFFIPSQVGVGIGVVTIGLNTAVPIGSNAMAANIAGFVNNPLVQAALRISQIAMPTSANVSDKKCFTKDWNGKAPS